MPEQEEKPQEEAQPKPEAQAASKAEASAKEQEPDTVSLPRATVERLIGDLKGARKSQAVFDKRERGYQETIQSLQVLSKFNELPEEQQQGLTNLAKLSQAMAESEGRAHGLSKSDVRYLSTLPWAQIGEAAEQIASESGTVKTGGDDELDKLLPAANKNGNTTQKRGSADTQIAEPKGQRAGQGGYKSLEAAVEASLHMPPDKARELLNSWGAGH